METRSRKKWLADDWARTTNTVSSSMTHAARQYADLRGRQMAERERETLRRSKAITGNHAEAENKQRHTCVCTCEAGVHKPSITHAPTQDNARFRINFSFGHARHAIPESPSAWEA